MRQVLITILYATHVQRRDRFCLVYFAGFLGSLENINPYILEGAVHGTDIPILATESRHYGPRLSGAFNNTNFFFVRRSDETEMQVSDVVCVGCKKLMKTLTFMSLALQLMKMLLIKTTYPKSLNVTLHLIICDFARRRQSLKSKCHS